MGHLSEFPKRPVPEIPKPRTQPMVYVYERQAWEYKTIIKGATADAVLSERELNDLGAGGWELVGVITVGQSVHYHFKRLRA
jgi:hypothetical protein